MSTYRGYEGIWATWDYADTAGPSLLATYQDVTDAARECASQGYGKVVFLRQSMSFQDSIDWFQSANDDARDWSLLRIAVLHGFDIAHEGGANLDQTLDIITDRVWMEYLNHETGMACVSTQTAPAEE